ncbi:MAG: PfkB family carbohydrate kinase [Pseudomonadota bacterium]
MKRKILAAGTIAFDTLETPNGNRERIIGGSGQHFSIAATLFTQVELSGIIGADFPKEHLALLNKRGVGTGNVKITDGKSFFWHGRYKGAMNGAETLETQINVLAEYDPVMNAEGKKCEVLFVANFSPDKQLKAINEAEGAKIVITDTMNYWITSALEDLKKVMKRTDIFIINEHEARLLTGETNIMKALHKVIEMGPRTIVIKRGEYGSFIYRDDEKIFFAPAYPVKDLVDPTGAGDTFAGGFVGYLAVSPDYNNFNELKKAMLYGSSTASFAVQGFGSEGIIKATRKDVDARYNELLSSIKID